MLAAALRDGDYETAAFFRPQGMTLADENTLYVADTENHAIRKIDLDARLVETVSISVFVSDPAVFAALIVTAKVPD